VGSRLRERATLGEDRRMTAPALYTPLGTPIAASTHVPAQVSGLSATVRSGAIVLAIAVLFSGAAYWGWEAGRVPVPPLITMLLVFALTAVGVLLDISRLGSGAVWAWATANACVAMMSFLWSSGSDVALEETRSRVLSSMQLVAYVILLADPRVRRVARVAIIASSLMAVGLNLYEITHPMAFSMSLGRSAGFYVNPNIAGAALIVGMLLGLPAVPKQFREVFMLVIAVGVFTTLSRGALLCWGAVTGWLLLSRSVRGKRLIVLSFAGATLAASIAGALMASGELGYLRGGAEKFVRQRLSIGNKEQLDADMSASSRSHLAMHALEMFGERPLLGHGVGATIEWNEPESTHNVYVRELAEYGIAGAWIAPLLLLIGWRSVSATDGTRGAQNGDAGDASIRRATAGAFVLFMALWGFFSHNVLDDPFMLIGVGLIATLPLDATRVVGRGTSPLSSLHSVS
jgi:hypothetical protein